MDINEKFASLTAEQSRALAAAMNLAYNEKIVDDQREDAEDNEDGKAANSE